MEITFVSSLTPDDETRFAAAFLGAVGVILDMLPIAYSIRVRTTSGKTLDRTHTPPHEENEALVHRYYSNSLP